MDYLYIAMVLGVIVCLVNDVWVAPFRPYYGFRGLLAIVILVLAIMKLAR